MNEFVLRTRITQFSTISEFAQNFQPDEQDCILTSRFLTNIFQIPQLIGIPRMIAEDYGQGEPTDQMIDAMRRDLPVSIRAMVFAATPNCFSTPTDRGRRRNDPGYCEISKPGLFRNAGRLFNGQGEI